jgi:Trypsin-like peptidase domain
MPRVPDEYLECVVYLYPSIPAAHAGEKVGGTGFMVRIDQGEHDFYYIVTNKHVIEQGNTTVRFNTTAGIHEAFDFDERNWIKSSNADLAIYPLVDPDPNRIWFRPIVYDQFLTVETMKQLDIGIGDEVFFAGRFINAEGKKKNRPSLRFGTIAQIHTDIIDGEESFLVEARSIPGYSGSPVFAYTMAGTPRSIVTPSLPTKGYGPFLLGVDWAHINDYADAKDDHGNTLPFRIRSNSGMMGVVPFWKLSELLFRHDVHNMRQRIPKAKGVATRDVASRSFIQ